MGLGLSPTAGVDALTDWGTTYRYVKLHVGDPGAAGTANPATNTTRVQADWGTPDSSTPGVVTMTHTDVLGWTSVPASEDYTHVSVWTASSGGTFGGSGLITADPVTVGNNFDLPIGAVVVSQPVAS
jgi:hypothetical protein